MVILCGCLSPLDVRLDPDRMRSARMAGAIDREGKDIDAGHGDAALLDVGLGSHRLRLPEQSAVAMDRERQRGVGLPEPLFEWKIVERHLRVERAVLSAQTVADLGPTAVLEGRRMHEDPVR